MESAFACSRPFGGLSSDRSCSRKLWCEYAPSTSLSPEDENYTLVRHESCSSSPEFSIPVSLFFLAHQILQVEKNYGEKKLHSIKLVLKALKFKCGEAGMVREYY